MAEYEVLEEDLRGYTDGEMVMVSIKDRETFESRPVKAIIYRTAHAIPDGESLWVKALESGRVKPEPWTIKIVDEVSVDEFATHRGGGKR